MTAIRIQDLRKWYDGTPVVDGVNLDIPEGEFFGLLGPNGAGKTTTLRMLLGLTPIDAGHIEVLGRSMPEGERAVRHRLGVVPQFDTLDPDFTVSENMSTYASYFGLSGPSLHTHIDRLLERVNLSDKRDAPIQSLSGGMKRRLTLARALINDPAAVILDEPTTGLDPQARHHLWRQLRELRASGVTLVLTTHYMEEAEELCDRIAIIDHGRIIACDTPAGLIQEHVEPWVATVAGHGAAASIENELGPRDRAHQVADTWLIYTPDPEGLRGRLEARGERMGLREANLEDVFLKLTGHDLRD
ncbi:MULTISPECIES: ABC transporter ATP-binding protein [unclassified Thioalkalivibrio]|uniref:ABC transporter ATP-binding protein n=1 Tax=unclassified Thioalkalivibrio TaxID=2621013 RepID=UPI000376D287|nr:MULTISPECIES: ATP-binding cassette domain-containing protein [unclassified Thioalkalivibrio]PYG03935.1 lipooligosaccharide transport system ATP-binding protein [Thioalkalivibrio sp. ALE21]